MRQLDNEQRAQCFAQFAPESIAHYLEHVWLGTPNTIEEPALAGDATTSLSVIRASELTRYRTELLDAMVTLYGGERETHARA